MTQDEQIPKRHRRTTTLLRVAAVFASAALALALPACKAFRVDVGTSAPIALDPIKFDPIDINMKVEVYQYTGTSKSDAKPDQTVQGAVENQRNRAEQLVSLLNSRWAGENHLGLLSIRHLPAGKDGAWVQEILTGENADREFLMKQKAKETGVPIEEIQRQQWENRKQAAWEGVVVEVAGAKPGEYRWAKKGKDGKGWEDVDGPAEDPAPEPKKEEP
jgi:hypothetical protein